MNEWERFANSDWFPVVGVIAAVLLISFTALGVTSWRKRHPAWRYTCLLSALLACLACPLVAAFVFFAGTPVVALKVKSSREALAVPLEPSAEASVRNAPEEPVAPAATGPTVVPPADNASAASSTSIPATPSVSAPPVNTHARRFDWAATLVGIWLLGTVVLLSRTARGLTRVDTISRRARGMHSDVMTTASREAAEAVGLARSPLILASAEVRSPVVVGYRRMSVIVPPSVLAITEADELRDILVHEFAHVKRRDPWAVLLQSLSRCLFWPILSIHWLDRELNRSREEICDNYVLGQTTPHRYGTTLLKLGELALPARPLHPAVGILNWRGQLADRIARFLDVRSSRETSTSRSFTAGMLLMFLGIGVVVCGLRFVAADDAVQSSVAEASPKAEPIDPAKSEEFLATVVDADGDPVAGATIELWQTTFAGGSRSPMAAYREPQITDAEGKATIAYPRFVDGAEKLPTKQLGLRVQHQDFPNWSSYLSIEHEAPIQLPRAIWATVAAHLPGGIPVSDDLFLQTSGLNQPAQRLGPALRAGPLDLSSRRPNNLLRVIHAPANGAVFFSNLIDLALQEREGDEIALSLVLQPASTVKGKLSDNVPRPIKNGVVTARILAGPAFAGQWHWAAKTTVEADGSFEINGLPADEHLQLIAICDGFLSLPMLPSEVTVYSKQFGLEVANNHGAGTGRVTPQLHYVLAGTSQTIVTMHATGNVNVRVVDRDDQPVAGARVLFNPNQAFHNGGSQALGYAVRSLDFLHATANRSEEEAKQAREALLGEARQFSARYSATTNADGEVTINQLPAHRSWYEDNGKDRPSGQFIGFQVTKPGYRLVPAEPQRIISAGGDPQETVDMKPGETVSIRVRMESIEPVATSKPAGVSMMPAPQKPQPIDSPKKPDPKRTDRVPITVSGVAKDFAGKPVAGAKVVLLSATGRGGELAETTTGQNGEYSFKDIPLPVRRSESFIDGGAISLFGIAEAYGISWHGQRSVLLVKRPENDPQSPLDTRIYLGEPIEMNLEFLKKSALSGQIVNEHDEPVSGATVRLSGLDFLDTEGKVYHHNYREFGNMEKLPSRYRMATSDAEGRFEITGLPHNTVGWVRISHDDYAAQSLYAAITDREVSEFRYPSVAQTTIRNGKVARIPVFETRPVSTTPLKIHVASNRSVTFNVVDSSGNPVADVQVSASSGGRATGTYAFDKSDEDGRVSLQLPPGKYRVVGRPPRDSDYVFTYDQLTIDGSDREQNQRLEMTSGCVLLLRAVDADSGQPIAGVGFSRDVRDRPGARRRLSSHPTYVSRPVTDENGMLRVIVEPGSRTIGVGFDALPEPYQGSGRGRSVQCEAGATVSLTFELRNRS